MTDARPAFEESLPLSITTPFLLTAPWFAAVAGLALAILGPPALQSRWSTGALALTHLLTVGFMLQAMCGALLEYSQVVVGAAIPRVTGIHHGVRAILAIAALALAAGLLLSRTSLLFAGGAGLVLGGSCFVSVLLLALWRGAERSATSLGLAFAVIALAVTIALGATLVAGILGHSVLPLARVTWLHAAWGLGGWAFNLLVAVSATVVPMLQLTPPYARPVPGAIVLIVLVSLCLATAIAIGSADPRGLVWPYALGLAAVSAFAASTLLLQARRRPAADTTVRFHRLAMVSFLAFALLQMSATGRSTLVTRDPGSVVMGILLLVGGFVSVISGMLYKILPFILWLDLNEHRSATQVPPLSAIVPESRARGQYRLHVLALAVLLVSPVAPSWTRGAGILFAASGAWLGINLARGVHVARQARKVRPELPAVRPA